LALFISRKEQNMNPIQLISEVEIPGWNCEFKQEGSGGGEWICHPPHDEIAPMAHKLWDHWREEAQWSHGATDPGPWHFWFESEIFIIEQFQRKASL
jgi:hypothetical protein